ncbi:hypothetical protein LCGC14_2448480 [marine sediment metagenome]|uniref:Enoyl-CoA hydratase n=1 Tax=marine sediment metagenome TaxID=412755 RepID=A0A0F9DTX7_9ZZZZ
MSNTAISEPREQGTIHTRREGRVAIAEFDNPDGGFFTSHMVQELDRLTLEWENDKSIRAIIITGKNAGTFITHYSPYELSATSSQVKNCKTSAEVKRMRKLTRVITRFTHWLAKCPPLYRILDVAARGSSIDALLAVNQFHRMLTRWQSMDKVIIAAINGHSMGGGCEIALACDFRLMARGDYSLGLPEAIAGIMPGAGGSQRMARLIGANKAIEYILTGRFFNADEAEQAGLISRAVDENTLMEEALGLAQQLAGQAPLSVAAVKRSIHQGIEKPMGQALE